jgi:hypothetical protein
LRGEHPNVGRFQLAFETRLFLLQQRHLIGLLLHATRGLAISRYVEQQYPYFVAVEIEM